MIDLAVVGGGPAGLMSALLAARAGLETVVLEPRAAPIDKACGEGLMPGAVAALEQVAVQPDGVPLRGIRYRSGEISATAAFPDGTGRGVRRTELHRALHSAAVCAGARIVTRRVDGVTQNDTAVHVAGITARYLVAADGLHSALRHQLAEPEPSRRTPPRRWGQRAHFARSPWTDHVEVYWNGEREAYVTPVATDQVGVAILGGRGGSWRDQLAGFPDLVDRLGGGVEPVGPVLAAGPLRQQVRRRTYGRVLLVGDAAGYVDALTGEGLGLAFACAAALVNRVSAGDPEGYEADWRRISRRSRLITTSLLWAARQPVLRSRIVPLAAACPALFRAAVAQLAH